MLLNFKNRIQNFYQIQKKSFSVQRQMIFINNKMKSKTENNFQVQQKSTNEEKP